jgi:hypothetical protein
LFAQVGLSDEQLIDRLKTSIDSGLGQKANNSDAIKGLKMTFELKNRFPSTHFKAELTQEDEIHMKLSQMSNEELMAHLEEVSAKTQELVAKLKKRREDTQKVGEVKIMDTKEVSSQPITPDFPKGVIHHFNSLSNQELGLPFKLIADVGQKLSTNVGAPGLEPGTECV